MRGLIVGVVAGLIVGLSLVLTSGAAGPQGDGRGRYQIAAVSPVGGPEMLYRLDTATGDIEVMLGHPAAVRMANHGAMGVIPGPRAAKLREVMAGK